MSSSKKRPTFSFRLRSSFFPSLVVVVAVVMVWRGVWNLLDMYVFPEQPILSNVVCIVVGLVLLYLPDQDLNALI